MIILSLVFSYKCKITSLYHERKSFYKYLFAFAVEDSEYAKAGTIRALARMAEDEGILSWYRGIVPVLQSICASNFVYFYTFHGLKSIHGGARNQSAARDLLIGSLAGITNVLVTTPLWVVNTRLKVSILVQNFN